MAMTRAVTIPASAPRTSCIRPNMR
jgi:hypothetical protein